MATITATNIRGVGQIELAEVTLTGTADTFTYTIGKDQVLIMRNPTGGAISPVIDGDGGTTVTREGVAVVDVSGGYAVGSIPAAEARAIRLDTINAYLQGVIAINSGTGLVCSLLNQ